MENFKKMLKINIKTNTDQIINNKFNIEINGFCEGLDEEKDKKTIEQIENRKNGINKLFIDYESNIQKIYRREKLNSIIKPNEKKQSNKIDELLQKVIKQAANEVYEKILTSEEKVQVLERMVGTMKLLENFDEYIEEIDKDKDQKEEINKEKDKEKELE